MLSVSRVWPGLAAAMWLPSFPVLPPRRTVEQEYMRRPYSYLSPLFFILFFCCWTCARRQVSQARLGEDDDEEVTPRTGTTNNKQTAGAGGGGGGAGAAGASRAGSAASTTAQGGGRPGGAAAGDGFTLTDAPQEMDVNLEYKELAREGDGDDADPDVMLGTQPGGTLKNVAFRVKNR